MHFLPDKNYLKVLTPILVAIIFVFLPLYYLPDSWDGIINQFAFDIQNLEGLIPTYLQSGWYIEYLIIHLIYNLSLISHISANNLGDFFVLLVILGISFETFKLGKCYFNLENEWALVAALLVIVFPAWSASISSILYVYIFCVWLVLLGYRLFLSKNLLIKFIGILIIISSFQLNSNFSFIIGLALIDLIILGNFQNSEFKNKLYNLIFIIILSIIFWVILRNFLPHYGSYEQYNAKLMFSDIHDLKSLLNFFVLTGFDLLRYFSYILGIAWIYIFIFPFIILFLNNKNENLSIKQGELISLSRPIIAILILSLFATFPYLVLGKSSSIFNWWQWNQRHALLLGPVAALFYASISRLLYVLIGKPRNIYIKYIPSVAVGLIFCVFLSTMYYHKFERIKFDEQLISELKKIPKPKPGNVRIVANNIPLPWHRSYESNYLMYKAYGTTEWWTQIQPGTESKEKFISSEKRFIPSKYIVENDNNKELIQYRLMYVAKDFKDNLCSTTIILEDGLPILERIKNFYILDKSKYYKIQSFKSDCIN